MNEIAIEKEMYDQLIAVTKWYDAMPDAPYFGAGDRFHENVSDFQHSCIPDDFEVEGMYASHFELDGDELFVAYGYEEPKSEEEEFVLYKIVSE